MATCKKCGNKYYNSICPCVINPSYQKTATKKKYLLKAFLITIGATILIGIAGAGVYDIVRLNKLVVEKNKKIIALQSRNNYLENKNRQDIDTISGLNKQNSNLRRSNNYNQRSSTIKAQTYNKPKTTITEPKTYTRNTTKSYNEPKTYTSNNSAYSTPKTYNKPVERTSTKKYQKFSKNIELVSDSKISMKNDNRLNSNMLIRGRFYSNSTLKQFFNNGVSDVKCGNNQKIYKVNNECSMTLLKENNSQDIVYLSSSNAKDISHFNYQTHMIECVYEQENGLMHDCGIKMIGVR